MGWMSEALIGEECKAQLEDKQKRIDELELAIKVHREKVQLIQQEDMDLWAHLNDGEQ